LIELAPNHTYHVRKYKTAQCIENGGMHPLCKSYNYNPSTGRLSRNSSVVRRWLVQQGFSTGTAPADTNVDHILPLCLGGPDCGCNFQLLTTAEHKLKTKEYDLPACNHFKVRI
jgi:hypothetical protein